MFVSWDGVIGTLLSLVSPSDLNEQILIFPVGPRASWGLSEQLKVPSLPEFMQEFSPAFVSQLVFSLLSPDLEVPRGTEV